MDSLSVTRSNNSTENSEIGSDIKDVQVILKVENCGNNFVSSALNDSEKREEICISAHALERENMRLNEELLMIKKELQEEKKETRELKGMNSKLTNQLFELMNEQTKELREDKERLYQELSTRGSGAKGKAIDHQLIEVKEVLETKLKQIDELNAKLAESQNEVQSIRDKAKLSEEKSKQQVEMIAKLELELEKAKTELKEKQCEFDKICSENATAMITIGRQQQKINIKEKDYAELINKYKELQLISSNNDRKRFLPMETDAGTSTNKLRRSLAFEIPLQQPVRPSPLKTFGFGTVEPDFVQHDIIACKIYAFDEKCSKKWAKFDCNTNKWTEISGGFGAYERLNFDVVSIGQRIFMIGGTVKGGGVSAICEAQNPDTVSGLQHSTMISRNAMLKPRQRHIALTIDDDKIYVFGGESMDKCGSSLSSVESYFVERDMWSSKSLMKQKRILPTSVLFDHVAYVIGGRNSKGVLNSVERYDPRQYRIEYDAEMIECRSGASAAVHNEKIYVAGGGNEYYLNTVEIYDPRAKQWMNGPPLNMAREGLRLISHGTRLLAIGGYSRTRLNSVEVLDTTENDAKWTIHPDIVVPFVGGIRTVVM